MNAATSLERVMKRDRAYFVLMAGCIIAVILAWTVVRLYSVTAAVVISVCAGLIPPVAAIVANAGDEGWRRR
jgi:ABC-type transport system involved in cytochrome bd biosynthesis fused ATPase/permease subunit